MQDQSFRIVKAPALTCHGDSGGPVLMAAEGQEFVVGIATAGDPGCLDYGDNLRVEASLETFLAPFLAPGAHCQLSHLLPPPRRPPRTRCAPMPCDDPQRCPAGLICQDFAQDFAGEGQPMRRCTLPGLLPGRLGERCTVSSPCRESVRAACDCSPRQRRCLPLLSGMRSFGVPRMRHLAAGGGRGRSNGASVLAVAWGLGLAAFGLLLLTAVELAADVDADVRCALWFALLNRYVRPQFDGALVDGTRPERSQVMSKLVQ